MSFTKCCNRRFIGDNHSPIQPDGYCLFCGFHPEIQKLQHQLKIQTKRVENLKKSNEFYANRKSWRKQTQTTNGLIIPEDQWDGKFKIGGKLARSCQAIDQELEKLLEEVK